MFFVYEDWTSESVPRCFYVGKGDQGRIKGLQRNNHHGNIVKAYGIDRRIVLVTSIERLALDVEVELIAEHKTFVYGPDYVFGVNYTRGGEGTSGFKPTNETRAKMKESAKTRPPITNETRQLLSRIRKNPSRVTREKLSAAVRCRIQSGRLEWNVSRDRCVEMLELDGTCVRVFSSIKEAAEETGTSRSLISQALNGHRETAKGYTWRYVGA